MFLQQFHGQKCNAGSEASLSMKNSSMPEAVYTGGANKRHSQLGGMPHQPGETNQVEDHTTNKKRVLESKASALRCVMGSNTGFAVSI